MIYTKYSLDLTQHISNEINNKTFHHHYHILYDIANTYKNDLVVYVEIGCYAGGSACLLLQRPNTLVISIDIGYPIDKEEVLQNVNKLNIYNNQYHYIKGNSHQESTILELKRILNGLNIDILFIDGGHNYNDVILDYDMYKSFVADNGYIVFDDYHDSIYSPDVKKAVDDIIKKDNDIDIIGTLPNIYNARPASIENGNCFIIKHRNNINFGIIIPTYYRQDGKSKNYLIRALSSVFNQSYQNFKIYLIGDRYEKEEEIYEILELYDKSKIYFENLPIAEERDNYSNKMAIWSYGGVNASNYGIDLSLKDNNYYICTLDHDDFWEGNHLELLNKYMIQTGSDWACTKSNYLNIVFPNINSNLNYIQFLPKARSLIRSSACMNFKAIPLKYKDLFKENGTTSLPSDADLWERCAMHIKSNGLKSILINSTTCNHLEEGYERSI